MNAAAALLPIVLALSGCAYPEETGTIPDGAITGPPIGYIKHCFDFPESIFCPQQEPEEPEPPRIHDGIDP